PGARPLAPVDMELRVLEEGDFSAKDRRDVGVVMVVVVVRDGEDVRVLARRPDGLPQLLLPRLLRRMRPQIVSERTESDARIDKDGDVRSLDERRHRPRPEGVGREGRDVHGGTPRTDRRRYS